MCLNSLGNMKYFSTLDLQSGYWQIMVAETKYRKNGEFVLEFVLGGGGGGGGGGGVATRKLSFTHPRLNKQQQGYYVTCRELLAILVCLREFRNHLLGCEFTIRTDHGSLPGCWTSRNRRGNSPGSWNTFSSFASTLSIVMGRSTPTLMPCRGIQCTGKDGMAISQVSHIGTCPVADVPTARNITKNGPASTKKWMTWCPWANPAGKFPRGARLSLPD